MIIVHAGTQKTGTSSLQNGLAANRDWLASRGVYYALGPHKDNVNFLARWIVAGRHQEAKAFVDAAAARARRAAASTLLLSAENLYAMSKGPGRPIADYWHHECDCVEGLRSLLPRGEVRVVFYLRRQDLFIESMYNQDVKEALGFTGDIDAFIEAAGPIGDYAGHLAIWRELFGPDAIVVRLYDEAKADLIGDFLSTLGLTGTAGFRPPAAWINERLDVDWLRFKCALNRVPMPLAERYFASRMILRLSRSEVGRAAGHSILSPARREAILATHADGNGKIASLYLGRPDGRVFDPPGPDLASGWCDGPLDPARAMQLRNLYRREMARPAIRAEILARRVYRSVTGRFPIVERMRRLLNARRGVISLKTRYW